MKGDLYCLDGRLMRHDPQYDDPELLTDIGQCPDCSGDGCDDETGEAIPKPGRSESWCRRAAPFRACGEQRS